MKPFEPYDHNFSQYDSDKLDILDTEVEIKKTDKELFKKVEEKEKVMGKAIVMEKLEGKYIFLK